MSWTEITREQYRRDGLRYASDTTDGEWKLIEPLMPASSRRGEISLRVITNAILYIAATGCQWRALRGAEGTEVGPWDTLYVKS